MGHLIRIERAWKAYRLIAIQSPYKIKWPTAPRSSFYGVSEYRIIHMIIIGIMRPLTCASYLILEASELHERDLLVFQSAASPRARRAVRGASLCVERTRCVISA